MQNDKSVNENGETLNRNDGNGKRVTKTKMKTKMKTKTETKTENATNDKR